MTEDGQISADELSGGADVIVGSDGSDILLGGMAGDRIAGDDLPDVIIGDNGFVILVAGIVTRVETKDFASGGNDTITGSRGPDIALGGAADDLIAGGGDVADDILLGDNGLVLLNDSGRNNDIESNHRAGGSDEIEGGPGEDIILGGAAGDGLRGGTEADIVLGDHGRIVRTGTEDVRLIETIFPDSGGDDLIIGSAGADIAMGGAGGDQIHGDAPAPGPGDGRDVLLGDNGVIVLVNPAGASQTGDAIVTFGGAITLIRTTDETAATGGSDVITGHADRDIIAGGVLGDVLRGSQADDVLLGDNGRLEWLYGGDPNLAGSIESGFVFDATFETLDLITTELTLARPHPGGRDLIFGDAGEDVILGGTEADTLWGDDGDLSGNPAGQDDLLFGDNGRLYPHHSSHPGFPSRNFFSIDTGDADGGAGDRILGEEGEDILLGQQGDDRIFGGTEDDDLIGGHNVAGGIDEISSPAVEASVNPPVNDVLDGGAGDDTLAGDNAVIWRQATGDTTNPRFRALTGGLIYNTALRDSDPAYGTPLVTADSQSDPNGTTGRVVSLLDHSDVLEMRSSSIPREFGDDLITGGAGDDYVFGQLGEDTLQGDGSVDGSPGGHLGPALAIEHVDSGSPSTAGTLYFNVPEGALDGDDYIEGNGGADLIFGGLGQDDLIGGSSGLFGLTSRSTRPDGADRIFGGAATRERLVRNAAVSGGDPLIGQSERHGLDADVILGDNGDIFRLVGTYGLDSGAFLHFNYDLFDPQVRSFPIIVRAIERLDYSPDPAMASIGAGDVIHGESADDIVHGMTGADVLYGDSEDDEIHGEVGNDWISGGTGGDAILGDDGLILTSRNGVVDPDDPGFSEPLYGVAAIPFAQLDRSIATPGGIQQAKINIDSLLKRTVDLTPFGIGADDIIYGGRGDDFLHGGAGDDAVSGSEALALSAARVGGTRMLFEYDAPSNPGNVLGHGDLRAGEFNLYDEFEPLREILLDENGYLVKPGLPSVGSPVEFLLNFEVFDAVGNRIVDDNDVVFGDLGNDWLVGGPAQDRLYGGYGDDLLNLDDRLDTNGGANDVPDAPEFVGLNTTLDPKKTVGADTAYGGAGRDVLIANSGADRLIDWVGEFNSYLVPFAPFGQFTVSRSIQPQLRDYLYELSESDGADPTRAVDTGSDPARNGEPEGELGLVLQTDVDWQEQTGGPADPQAGNIPGGKRDVMEAADFNSGHPSLLAAVSGVWSPAGGAYQGAASPGGEAISLMHVRDMLPDYFEILVTVNADKDLAGVKSNAFVVFDYYGPTDFKFAGVNVMLDKLQVGRRTQDGWIVDAQSNMHLKPHVNYNLMVALHGSAVTLVVDGTSSLPHSFASRVVDGLSQGLNTGMLGLATREAVSRFDNVKVQRPAPLTNFQFDVSQLFIPQFGSWSWDANGAIVASPASAADQALSTLSIGVAASSFVEIEGTITTATSAGLVFDFYGPEDFKFAAILVDDGRVAIGHRTARGWIENVPAALPSIATGSHALKVSLAGTTVSLTVDGRSLVSHSFNGSLNDGDIGLLSRGGASSFDSVVVRGDDPEYAGPLATSSMESLAVAKDAEGHEHEVESSGWTLPDWVIETGDHVPAAAGSDTRTDDWQEKDDEEGASDRTQGREGSLRSSPRNTLLHIEQGVRAALEDCWIFVD